jgi:hypothetical protein
MACDARGRTTSPKHEFLVAAVYHGTATKTAELRERFEHLSEACMEPLPGIIGAPSDNWLLGYIWRMGVGWCEFTTANISPRGYFPRFLSYGLKGLRRDNESIDYEPIDLESLIKTAIKRFHMKSKEWLRPGDDLSRFPV